MNKYINAEKLKAEIKRLKGQLIRGACASQIAMETNCKDEAYNEVLTLLDSLQQEQPIEGKQVIIITETDGGANIHWDCRSLEDVRALLTSAESFIIDKQVEEARGQGSAPDYNTTEGRFRNAHKLQQEQPEVDFEEEISDNSRACCNCVNGIPKYPNCYCWQHKYCNTDEPYKIPKEDWVETAKTCKEFELELNARKKK